MKKLSILIPTIAEREQQFRELLRYIQNILDLHDINEQVEVGYWKDNKEMTIGEKREWLYHSATGLYSWQIDDDDSISREAILQVLNAMESNPDCITFAEMCMINGKEYHSNFSLEYPDWGEDIDGWDFVRTPFFKTPIKTEICRSVPVPHIRFGEDHQWSRLIKPLLKTEVHINGYLYYYNHESTDFNQRYGIQ